MIDAGIDEVTAFKLAAAAMAQNAEEFDRVAMEVCTDVNGNFNQAAYDLAQTMYHTGGFVGDEPLKPNERYIKAEDGELMMTSNQQDSLAAQLDRIGAMAEKFMNTPMPPPTLPIAGGLSQTERSTINNITNNSSNKPVTINQGDVVIQGTVLGPKELAQSINKYIKMTEDMVNQFARLIGIKW